jgi:hypothetical protein
VARMWLGARTAAPPDHGGEPGRPSAPAGSGVPERRPERAEPGDEASEAEPFWRYLFSRRH